MPKCESPFCSFDGCVLEQFTGERKREKGREGEQKEIDRNKARQRRTRRYKDIERILKR